MEIIRAKKMGVCFGVKEAIETCMKSVKEMKKGKNIFVLGMLVHNEHVVKEIENLGIKIIEEEKLLQGQIVLEKGDIVIIRAHGTTKEIYEYLEEIEVEIRDATCVFVKDIRKKIVELERNGENIIFIGDKDHPEVSGILSFSNKISVFSGIEELKENIGEMCCNKKYSLLTQTTLNTKKVQEIKKYLENTCLNVTIYNKICSATQERQEAVEELAKYVDLMLIIGGKKSSNTKKLFEISEKYNENTKLIDSIEEINEDWFKSISKIGISAGASTPEEIIKKIEDRIRGIKTK